MVFAKKNYSSKHLSKGYGPAVHDLTSSEGQISVLRVRGPKWYRVISLTAANAVAEAQGMPGMHRHTCLIGMY